MLLNVPSARRVQLSNGDVLIHEGETVDLVYVLLNGELEVVREVDDDTAVLAILDTPGTLVGEMVALGGGTRTATVTAQGTAELLEVAVDDFQRALQADPALASELTKLAIRRAEEAELTEILANHFGITSDETLVSACSSVEWLHLAQGEALIEEGEDSKAVYFVVRGRLVARTLDRLTGERTKSGEVGSGDVVGEMGLRGQKRRSATVTAVRDTVVAGMDELTFMALVDRHPRMLIELSLRAVARAGDPRWHSAPSSVLAVISHDDADYGWLIDGMQSELANHGVVKRLSPALLDAALETPGIHNTERNAVATVRVSRMIHEYELAADHLIVEVGQGSETWLRRALGMADRVLVAAPSDLTPEGLAPIQASLIAGSTEVPRTLVIVDPASRSSRTGSRQLARQIGAEEVIHVAAGSSDDAARVARMSVGKANTLVLSGGGGRGFAHIGVFRALRELGWPIDLIGGTSMGAVLGTVMADGLEPDEIVDWAQTHFPKALDYTLPLVSLTKGGRIAGSALATFGNRDIEDMWLTYFAMSTDLTPSRSFIPDPVSVV